MKDNPVAKHAHKFNKSAVHKEEEGDEEGRTKAQG